MILKNTYLLTNSGWNTAQNLTIGQKVSGIYNNKLILSVITDIKKHQYSKNIYTINKSPLLPDTKLLTKNNRLQKIKNIKNTNNLSTPKYDYSGYKLNPITHKKLIFDTCLILKLIGYFVECGELKKKNTITFKNSKNKLNTIAETLNLLKIENFMSISNKGLLLISYDKYLYDFLLQFGTGRNKCIPRRFLNLDKFYLCYLLEAMLNSSSSKTTQSITVSSAELVNNTHELIIKLGFLFNTTAIYREPMRREQYNPIDYDGAPYFDIRIIGFPTALTVTKSKINTTIYSFSLNPAPKFILIRNDSIPLWVTF